jgi:hypothetical protein
MEHLEKEDGSQLNRQIQTAFVGNFWDDSGFSSRTKNSPIKLDNESIKTIG